MANDLKKDNKALKKELKAVNNDIKTLNDNLIKGLKTVGIEYINLDTYINTYNKLSIRKNKIMYLIALNIE